MTEIIFWVLVTMNTDLVMQQAGPFESLDECRRMGTLVATMYKKVDVVCIKRTVLIKNT